MQQFANVLFRLLLAVQLYCLTTAAAASPPVSAGLLDKRAAFDAQKFWDNQDFDWYARNIPFFECPEDQITTTYYYRWELLTKHLTYGSPTSGYTFTEFIDRPFWSGTYGAISCPAGHQLYEARWLRDPRYVRDYARYWFRTPGAEPRNYSTWLADAIWASHRVHPDDALLSDLLPDLKRNYEGWESTHFDPAVGLFWQTGHDDGMEININSRQTQDIVRGAPGYRPTLNSYLWADALAIARMAELVGDADAAETYRIKAAAIKENLQQRLWDPERQFFFHVFKNEEMRDGHVVKAGTRTYESGEFAGSPYGRELIGFVPWQFGLPDAGYEDAWNHLMDRDHFFADYGPTTVERKDPLFHLSPTCCWWSGQSWPYATTQTLLALANLLRDYDQDIVTREDYVRLLSIYAKTHQKNGRPYLAEAAHPDTGSWQGHDAYNHSEHYFHSGFTDLIVTGLVGLRPRDDELLEVEPLAPAEWDYFAIDDVPYKGRLVSILWDRDGQRYQRGAGFRIFVDGEQVAVSDRLARLTVTLPPMKVRALEQHAAPANFAVNNDGGYYPRVTASFTASETSPMKAVDGNYWYHLSPPNRWTTEGSRGDSDWIAIDFGTPRRIDRVELYPLDDGEPIASPERIELESWNGTRWSTVPNQTRTPEQPMGHRANVIRFPELETTALRAVLVHRPGFRSGLTEFEAWGEGSQPLDAAPPPLGNLAFNSGNQDFPKASASYTSHFDRVERANNGQVNFTPNPPDRWTSFESPNASDWLEIDFGRRRTVGRIELAIYDDRGGVQAPQDYVIEQWDGRAWKAADNQQKSPARPAGGQFNEVRFKPVETAKMRVVFTHRGKARSGISEIYMWPK